MLFMSVINFFSCVQLEGQTIETYVTQLKTLASTCKFAEQENGLIRDHIVLGIKDSGLQERLLRENNLNMKKATEIVRAAEASRGQIRNMKYDIATINFVNENQNKHKTQHNCKKCGQKHKPRECPAFGKICAKCKNKNYFAAKCFQSTKSIHEMNVPENELVYIDSVNKNETKCAMKNSTDSNFKNVEMVRETTKYKNASLDVINKCFDVNFKLDTGADILPLYILINVKSKPILRLRGCKELKLIERIDAIECSISKNELIKQYKDIFTGVGEFTNEPYHITLKENAVPIIHPPRRVPLVFQPKLKSTLDKLEKEEIKSKVKPIDWVQSLVIVEKPNGNLRLCLDPRDLNKVIKREHYQIPCTDIISKLEGKEREREIFSVVDLKDGFWHVPLDEKRNQKLFGDIEGVEIYFDGIIAAGCDEDSHDAIMSRVFERAKLLNIKFNPDKPQYRVSEVKYVGQIISKSGIKPDPDQIKAFVERSTGIICLTQFNKQ
ncbi:uncharacterized protein K02A2.6 [Trichonephila clavipes]|nr:uncharacterized protein K02A2.6 [Trichonephila clavipes]